MQAIIFCNEVEVAPALRLLELLQTEAFRVLAEYLEQNPGALVRGKEVEDKQ